MRIKISGRHMDVADSLKAHANEKSENLNRFYDRLQSVEVIFDQEAGKVRCEMIASADHHTTFIAKESHADAIAAFDSAIKDVERQLTRHKEKHRNRKHLTGPEANGGEA